MQDKGKRKVVDSLEEEKGYRVKKYLMSTSIAAIILQLIELPTLLHQPRFHTNLEVTMLYK